MKWWQRGHRTLQDSDSHILRACRSPGKHVKTQIFDPVTLGWGLRSFISNKLSGDANVVWCEGP